ncbi:MAG TPA: glycosyl hydrolase family 28-related protein, partial [Ignavibacteriaceae bacterium]|nr:glycosyl hydrolase family 28-related protein [Ignavibacteriaceae bacterium]
MKKTLVTLIILMIVAANNFAKEGASTEAGWKNVNKILEKIKAPKFADKDFDITKYGAVADGKTLCTKAFVKAIEACSKAGGGRVVVPKGEFLTGAI